MESVEGIINKAIELLDENKNIECKKYLKGALVRIKKANIENELKYIKELEDNLK